jgi:hypothetical protein
LIVFRKRKDFDAAPSSAGAEFQSVILQLKDARRSQLRFLPLVADIVGSLAAQFRALELSSGAEQKPPFRADKMPTSPLSCEIQCISIFDFICWRPENAALRQKLIVLRRNLRGRVKLANSDRWFFIQLYRWFPSILKVLTVIRPEALVRWHRTGFRSYWRWKSRSLGGRPQIDSDLRALIRRMSIENSHWGAPRIHGELLKLGFAVAQSSVAKYISDSPEDGLVARNCYLAATSQAIPCSL